MSKTLKVRIARIIGRTRTPDVLDCIFDALACEWKMEGNRFYRVEHVRSEQEVLIGAAVLQQLTLLATRTYEGKSITTGIVVGEKWALDEPLMNNWQSWIAIWPDSLRPMIEKQGELFSASALADGKQSLMVADTTGNVIGVINIAGLSMFEALQHFGGYAVITNRHREVFLFGQDIYPVSHYDGFEWKHGGYIGPIYWVDHWAHFERDRPYFEKVAKREFPIELPQHGDEGRWFGFSEIVDALAERRLSSILAVCDQTCLTSFQNRGVVAPLKPELNGITWGDIDNNMKAWISLFRLDGVHFLSREMSIMAVCQQVSVPKTGGASQGTGRSAARYLSEELNHKGVVIKVSSDGPATVFYRGRAVDNWIDV